MLKFESLANVGDTIIAYDFFRNTENYIKGEVIAKGEIRYSEFDKVLMNGYTIKITEDSGQTEGGRVGDEGYVPFELDFVDYDDRILITS
jgi:hypothetical protein